MNTSREVGRISKSKRGRKKNVIIHVGREKTENKCIKYECCNIFSVIIIVFEYSFIELNNSNFFKI